MDIRMHSRRHPPADRWLYNAYLLILIWAPLPLASNRLWSQSLLSLLILALVIGTAYGLLRNKFELSPVIQKAWWVAIPLVIVASWASTQATRKFGLSIDPNATLHEAVFSWALAAMFLLTLQLVRSRRRLRLAGYVIVGCGLFQAVYGSLMVMTGLEYSFFIPKEAYIDKNVGTFINRNSQAGYLVMCVSLGVGLMVATLESDPAGSWREVWRRVLRTFITRKIILRISLLIIVAGLVMTHSRMGNSSFFISLTVMGFIGLVLARKATLKIAALLASLLVLDMFVMGAFFGIDKVAQRLEATTMTSDGRADALPIVLEIAERKLFLGTGLGTFETEYVGYREQGVARFDKAHNDYLQFVSEIGVVPTLLMGIFIAAALYASCASQAKRKDPFYRGVGLGVSMAIVAMLVHVTVDFNLQMPANALTFIVLLAAAWIALVEREK